MDFDVNDVSYWSSVLAETYSSVLEKEELSPLLIAALKEDEVELLIKSFSLKAKAVVRNVRCSVLRKEEISSLELLEKKTVIQKELSKISIFEDSTSEDEDEKKEKPSKLKINWKNIVRKLPKFEGNAVKFVIELERFMIMENIDMESWYCVAVKCLSWANGVNELVTKRNQFENLPWKEGKIELLELIEPNFKSKWLSKLTKFRPKNNQSLAQYFEDYQNFAYFNVNKLDEKIIAMICFENLPEFIQLKLKTIHSSKGLFNEFESVSEIQQYSKLVLDNKYNENCNFQKTIQNKSKQQRCYKCNKFGHIASNCNSEQIISRNMNGETNQEMATI